MDSKNIINSPELGQHRLIAYGGGVIRGILIDYGRIRDGQWRRFSTLENLVLMLLISAGPDCLFGVSRFIDRRP